MIGTTSLKQRILGTGKSSIYLSNPYHDNNFDHAVRLQDIFKYYTEHLPPTTRAPRNGKKRVRRKKLIKDKEYELLPYKVSRAAIDYIIKGVLHNEFNFVFARERAVFKYVEIKNKAIFYKKYKDIDPLENNFRAYSPCISIQSGETKRNTYIYLDKSNADILKNRLCTTDRFSTIKTLNTKELSKIIQKQFPKFEIKIIYNILMHLFRYIKAAIAFQVNLVFFFHSKTKLKEYLFIKGCKSNYSRSRMLLDKYLFLYRMDKRKRDKWCYFALTHEECNKYKEEPIYVKLHVSQELAMLDPLARPHIFRVEMEKPVNTYSIFSTIAYETHNTKYIWRWNEQRFESVDNSKLHPKRRVKRNSNNV